VSEESRWTSTVDILVSIGLSRLAVSGQRKARTEDSRKIEEP
jgi:hypothetical protein